MFNRKIFDYLNEDSALEEDPYYWWKRFKYFKNCPRCDQLFEVMENI